ncbi:MSHA biogenesis protein MshP [Duganella sp. FT92W]|uniref:MSHA biogenesis protein MshP n=1 Tax=Pseudoduganella rivuli TaxID=2666085 RepID=A0A7X2IL62_9BURK|nr:MSHA biogenesis protein MshP [Pseudoduganella rivuli]MRV71483.1 MSHA biogenesis protein MshP [Pseudoduganella rivuli]
MTITRKHTAGFAYIAAVVLLVVLATLGITVSRLSNTQQITAAEDAMQAYALQAARAGTDWGLYQALQNAACAGTTTLPLSGSSGGFNVTVTCNIDQRNEGVQSDGVNVRAINIYTITATACNSASCPDDTAATKSGYVERKRVVTLCATGVQAPC